MEIREAQQILKQHAYYMNCSYKTAWNNYIHESIKKRYSFAEVMRNI